MSAGVYLLNHSFNKNNDPAKELEHDGMKMAFSQTHCSQKQLSHILTERTTLPLPVLNTSTYIKNSSTHLAQKSSEAPGTIFRCLCSPDRQRHQQQQDVCDAQVEDEGV